MRKVKATGHPFSRLFASAIRQRHVHGKSGLIAFADGKPGEKVTKQEYYFSLTLKSFTSELIKQLAKINFHESRKRIT